MNKSSTAANPQATKDEKSKRKAMLVRAVIYIAATHVWAAFLILLFTLGKH
ncbi:hypothetical protein P3T37_004104 [Kitasatospora sp. MAA4]|jgi:hypothetical protein|uniref:DUF6126 family protein n=1 Tax=Kitasatospora sp. MAA4 TaxID=3035093 RepID=UPI0024750381|nr:DUF6126 family protein [Kitasatospora sp. MAA4]MDH6134700.1 hypothetical protein [Kitasatospora sp. MAA4]